MTGGLTLSGAHVNLRDGDRAFRLVVEELSLDGGAAVALTGASGSGKTLLLELLGLLRQPGQGTCYRWGGDRPVDLAALWRRGPRDAELARMRGRLFGFVPQTGGLMPFLSVADNVALPQRIHGRGDAAWHQELLSVLGLAEIAALPPAALSIGQRQRTAIARALAHRPPFLIADEPTAALDSDSADTVLDLLLSTARAQGSGVILSSHDIGRLERFDIPRLTLSVTSDGPEVTSRPLEATC